MNVEMNEQTLITNKEAREQNLDRIDVLDKVGNLLLMPSMEMATIKQLAEFFGTPFSTINNLVNLNMDELEADGVRLYRKTEIMEVYYTDNATSSVEHKQGYSLVNLKDGTSLKINNPARYLFPKRAILRVGMLLRDSDVAKEIRSQLLNTVEHVHEEAPELLTRDITEEKELRMDLVEAEMAGDELGVKMAYASLMKFKNRHIEKVEKERDEVKLQNKLLAGENVQFESPRKLVTALVQRYGSTVHGNTKIWLAWGEVSNHLRTRLENGINLKSRKTREVNSGNKKATLTSVIRDEELTTVIKVVLSMCEKKNVKVSDIVENAREHVAIEAV